MERIAIIGNAGGGKSTLAHALGEALRLPVHHMDALWETDDCKRRPDPDVNADILRIAKQPRWIIEGWMPFSGIPLSLEHADTIIYIKHPLWVHSWWTFKREIKEQLFGAKPYESTCGRGPFMTKIARVVWGIWKTYEPRILKMVEPYRSQKRVIVIRSPRELMQIIRDANGSINQSNS